VSKQFVLFVAALISLSSVTSFVSAADWPARVFAPYMYLGSGDNFKLTDCDDASGQKFYTLAFIIADKEKNPAWDGRTEMMKNLYGDQIDAIRSRGGNVIVSFGGAGGTELALAEPDVVALTAKYQSVIDQYKLTWLDFDIEGSALEKKEVNVRRNMALANLQKNNPGLIISFTLPVDPNGLSEESRAMLADAKAKGVVVHSANLMTMDFGSNFSKGKKMSDVSIASVNKTHEQCQGIDANMLIGICPMIGQNDEKGEIFTLEDAAAVRDWAMAQPWVCSLSFWASNRDTGAPGKKNGNASSGIEQKPWDFTNVFKSFTAK
jgi:Glycosyl hydrolases family 18